MPAKSEDDATNQRTRASPEGEGLSAAVSPQLHQREAYSLLVRVTHNVDSVSVLDAKVPDYVWTEVIARDICTYQVGAPDNTFTVELLSDMEFLLFEGPWSRPGITWENAIAYIRILHDIRDWGGTEVTVVDSQHTMKQSRINLANTREYCRARILGWLAAVEGKARSLAIENTKTPIPQGRGWGYMRRADHYFAQKTVGGPAQEPTLHALRPVTPEDYHSAHESSEFEYESEGSEGSGTDSTGYSSTTTAASHQDTDHTQCSNARIQTRNAGNRAIMTGKKAARPMLKSRETGEVAGWYCHFSRSPPRKGIDVR